MVVAQVGVDGLGRHRSDLRFEVGEALLERADELAQLLSAELGLPVHDDLAAEFRTHEQRLCFELAFTGNGLQQSGLWECLGDER